MKNLKKLVVFVITFGSCTLLFAPTNPLKVAAAQELEIEAVKESVDHSLEGVGRELADDGLDKVKQKFYGLTQEVYKPAS